MSNSNLDSIHLRELLGRVRAGDRKAADRLFQAIHKRFHRLARNMLRDFPAVGRYEESGDIAQDALLRFLKALKKVTPETTRDFFNLAAELIRRQLIDLARRYRKDRQIEALKDDSSGDGQPLDPTPPAAELDRWEQFHRAVAELPVEQREVIGLRYYHGWTYARIAELFGVTERTVARRLKEASEALAEATGGPPPGL